jgi:hypothetical protein
VGKRLRGDTVLTRRETKLEKPHKDALERTLWSGFFEERGQFKI